MATQDGWRWCSRCQVLVYGGFGNGVCFDGEQHFLADSGPYSVPIGDDPPPDTQAGWRWCSRCQVMVFGGSDSGVCWDGEPHYLSDSSEYSLLHGAADTGQQGWRWCSRCQVLFYAGFGDGICWDGRRHYPDESGPYSVTFTDLAHPPPPPDMPPRPRPPTVEVTEQYQRIAVGGAGFTPNGSVRLSFVRGADVKKIVFSASGDGRIHHVETVMDDERVGGAVIAVDLTTDLFGIGRTRHYFPHFRPIDLAPPDLVPSD